MGIPDYISAADATDETSYLHRELFGLILSSKYHVASFEVRPTLRKLETEPTSEISARLVLAWDDGWNSRGSTDGSAELVFCDVRHFVHPRPGHSALVIPRLYLEESIDLWCYDTPEIYILSRAVYARYFHRPVSSSLGSPDYLPTDDVTPATTIESDWRLCSACSEAWQHPRSDSLAYCPACHRLTRVDEVEPA